jgi:peptide/nickel transport system substrate-binding protein
MQVEHTETVTKYERNPYYFKVDAAGQQLPYIDWIRSDLVETHEQEVLKIISGEVDYRAEGGLQNLALYKENEDKGGYDTYLLWMHRTNADPRLNLTYEDETFRSVVRDVRFRRALNMAINREEIIDVVYYGFAELPTSVPSEYDPDGANALLDEMGMDKRDADGWRLAPNGEPFSITFELDAGRPDRVPVCELVVEYWKEVGVNTDMKVIEASLRTERENANLTQAGFGWSHWPAMVWGGPWGELPGDVWGELWHQWLTTDGEQGEEPPEIVKRDFYVVNRTWVAGPKERQELSEEHRQILYENIWQMHIGDKFRDPVTIKRGLKNFATDGFGLANNRAWELFYWEE